MEQFLVFSTNKQNFAIEIPYVTRIIEYQNPIKIPESSDFLLGIIKYNELVLPVIDLSIKLFDSLISYDQGKKIVIVEFKDRQIGLLVEKVLGVYKFEEDQYENSDISTDVSREYIKGFIKLADEITIVLEPDKLFIHEQEEEIISASQWEE